MHDFWVKLSAEILRSGSMIAIAVVLIVILQKIASYFRRDVIELNEVTDSHYWTDLDTLLKTYTCLVCDSFLTGNCGRQCDNCGICCHDTCIKQADIIQKCKDVYSVNDEGKEKHLWVKDGNLLIDFEDPDLICYECDEECCETESSLMQCCWCQRVIHSQCHKFLSDLECDFGEFRNFIIPSFCITPTKSIRSRRKFRIKELSRPDWKEWTPVIVMANRQSGNSDGIHILSFFRRVLNPCQVLDLSVYSPLLVLKWCSVIPADVKFFILVAGGDGTVAWILNTINKPTIKLPIVPAVGIIPLGTGNDLSRVLGWGKEHNNSNSPTIYLKKLSHCSISDLDRWIVSIKTLKNISIRKLKQINCYNYLSIGVDAKVAFDFHQTRQTSSLYMPSRFFNKLLYTFFGTRQAMIPDCSGLEKRLQLFLDGVKVTTMPELESIVIMNIPSWAAGVKLWKPDPETSSFRPQAVDDGLLEVVGIYSSFHIAQLQMGLSEPYYIGQASEVKILLRDTVPMQIDGEPWVQHPSEIIISLCNQAKVLKTLD